MFGECILDHPVVVFTVYLIKEGNSVLLVHAIQEKHNEATVETHLFLSMEIKTTHISLITTYSTVALEDAALFMNESLVIAVPFNDDHTYSGCET